MGIYDFRVRKTDGTEIPLSEYEGKVLLIVNTATACGFTPQYSELQEIYEDLKDRGLEILDFPCNQFGQQAPGSDAEIQAFCTGRFGITFPQFAKTEVNGANAHPLYAWLRENGRFEGFGDSPAGRAMADVFGKMDPDYMSDSSIKWNFTKFLISRDGKLVARFEPPEDMKTVRKAIEEELG